MLNLYAASVGLGSSSHDHARHEILKGIVERIPRLQARCSCFSETSASAEESNPVRRWLAQLEDAK